jgi:hypothetical protein
MGVPFALLTVCRSFDRASADNVGSGAYRVLVVPVRPLRRSRCALRIEHLNRRRNVLCVCEIGYRSGSEDWRSQE